MMIKYFRRWLFKIEMKLKYFNLIIKVNKFNLWIHSIRISVTKKSLYSKSQTKKYNNYKSSCQSRHQGYWFRYKTKRKYHKSIFKLLFKQEIFSKWFIKCHLFHLNLWNILQIRFWSQRGLMKMRMNISYLLNCSKKRKAYCIWKRFFCFNKLMQFFKMMILKQENNMSWAFLMYPIWKRSIKKC